MFKSFIENEEYNMKNSTLSLMGIRVDNWSDLYSLEHQVPNP